MGRTLTLCAQNHLTTIYPSKNKSDEYLRSKKRRSLVSARCDGFRVDAHPLPSLFSKRAGPLDASFFPGFCHFCFWFSQQVCWFLYFYGFLLVFLRFLCFLFIFFSFILKNTEQFYFSTNFE
jgi:hypothetical protein